MQWQPIETAPKNYETVWVSDGADVELARRAPTSPARLEAGLRNQWWSAEHFDWDGNPDDVDFTPTHWMARPLPPK